MGESELICGVVIVQQTPAVELVPNQIGTYFEKKG